MKNISKTNSGHKNSGFTLPEVILIVAALAIVSAMAMPDIAYFFGRQTVEQEKLTLANIQKAMDSYAKECNRLPTRIDNPPRREIDTNGDVIDPNFCSRQGATGDLPWYEALSAFSNMSASGIENDVWGNPRVYTRDIQDRQYRHGSVIFNYATVRSIGQDRVDNTSPEGEGDWTNLAEYESFSTEGDDLMVKYTDSQWKIAAQDETVQRMERIIDALDRYAQARFNEEVHRETVAREESDPDFNMCISEKIFYPPSQLDEDRDHYNPNHPNEDCRDLGRRVGPGPMARYGEAVTDDVLRITGDGIYVNTQVGGTPSQDNERGDEMRELMRILGLPEDHCCNAITGEPFYYYSNPPTSNGDYAIMPPYFPPQVRVSPL